MHIIITKITIVIIRVIIIISDFGSYFKTLLFGSSGGGEEAGAASINLRPCGEEAIRKSTSAKIQRAILSPAGITQQ